MQSWELTTFPPKRICRSPVSDDHHRPPNSGPHPPPQKGSLKTVTALMPLCIMSFSIMLYIKLLAATGGASAARMKLGTSRVVEGICRWENLTWRWQHRSRQQLWWIRNCAAESSDDFQLAWALGPDVSTPQNGISIGSADCRVHGQGRDGDQQTHTHTHHGTSRHL